MVIAEYNIGGARVRVHDDCLKSEEESREIMRKVTAIIYNALRAKKIAELMKDKSETNQII